MTGHINTLTAQATIDERRRTAASARTRTAVAEAATSRSRRRLPALVFAARLARPRVA